MRVSDASEELLDLLTHPPLRVDQTELHQLGRHAVFDEMNAKTADTDVVQAFNHFLVFDRRRVFGDASRGFRVKACGNTTFQHVDVDLPSFAAAESA